jgi:ribonucleoside-diphosphate reductase alpha chain
MAVTRIKKRNGDIVAFDLSRIIFAVQKAKESTDVLLPENFSSSIAHEVFERLEISFQKSIRIPSVEEVQDYVERVLVESGNFEIAKTYILYRAEHAKRRTQERIEELEKISKNLLKVTKRNGKQEVFQREKLKKTFSQVQEGYEKQCSFEEVYDIVKLMMVDNVKTTELTRLMRRASVDLLTSENVGWQHISGRLYALEFYGEAMRNRNLKYSEIYSPKAFLQHVDDYIQKEFYYTDLYSYYSREDLLKAGEYICKERDYEYGYSTMLSFHRRYLLNPNGIIHELPQEMYLMVALFLAIPEPKESRLSVAKDIYEVCSSQKLSLPTPTLLNARTNYHQLSSCFKLNIDDDLRGIYHQIENMAQISKFGGGIGAYLGNIRSRGSSIRYVENVSGGVIPWVRVMNDTATAVNQLGARNGAISPTLDIWHNDIHDFLHLQTESGDIRSKAFDVFPAVSIPDIFMKRVEENASWTLFDPHEIEQKTGKRIQDLFGSDFEEFYISCEQNTDIQRKESISAKELFKTLLKTVVETGMPYAFFRDTVNALNPNKHVGNIYSTQLCTEICQNTSPSMFLEEEEKDGELSIKHKMGDTVVCNLASINVAKVYTEEEIRQVFPVAMRTLDNIIQLNFYPIKEAEITAKKYRSVGLGFMGLAEYLACNKLAYDKPEAREDVDYLFEKYAFAALEASKNLAQERGAYHLFQGSEWSKGILFGRDVEWYKKHTKNGEKWESLIQEIREKGLRFSYHLAPAPNTSTAGVVGTTAGLLPIYKRLFVETNSIAPVVTVAPNLSQENFWFYKEYQRMNMEDVIDMFAVIYKWIDQSASFEWMINPAEISPVDLYKYYFRAWKKGIKTVYYVRSMSGEIEEDSCVSCSG